MESVEGFTPAFGGSLFAAAAAFARASPWESLAERRPIQITYRLVLRVSCDAKPANRQTSLHVFSHASCIFSHP
jgi:hypothetical protein